MARIIPLIWTLWYAGTNFVLGLALLRIFSRGRKLENNFPFSAILASGFLLGQGILANVWLLLGLASCFKPSVIWSILFAITIIGILLTFRFLSGIFYSTKTTFAHVMGLPSIWRLLLYAVCLVIFVYGMKSVIMPPDGDAFGFYMVFPKIMASAERLTPQPNYYAFSQVGFFGEMHYAALFSIGNQHAAKFFVWCTSLSLIALLVALCKATGIKIYGQIVAVIMLLTSSTVTNYITDGKVDIFGGVLGIAAYYWALQTTSHKRLLPYMFAGIFTGFSIVAKFSNIPVVLSGVILLIIWNQLLCLSRIRKSLKDYFPHAVRLFLIFGSFLLLAIVPHLFKNAMLFREPFAPFIFLGKAGAQWVDQVWYSPAKTRYILMTYPFALVFGQYPMQGGNISALVLAFSPLCGLMKKPTSLKHSPLFQSTIIAITGVLIWIIVRPAVLAPRYILATLLLFIPLAAKSTEYLLSQLSTWRLLHIAVYVTLFLALFIVFEPHIYTFTMFKNYLIGEYYPCEIRSGSTEYCRSLHYINRKVRQQGTRLYIGGYYTYYLRPDLLQCINSTNPDSPDILQFTDQNLWEQVFNNGFEYLVIQQWTHASLLEAFESVHIPPWLQVKRIYTDNATIIYSLFTTSSEHIPQYQCKQIKPPAWDVVQREYNSY